MFRMNLRGSESREIQGQKGLPSDRGTLESWRTSHGGSKRRKALQMTARRSRQLHMPENLSVAPANSSSLANKTNTSESAETTQDLPPTISKATKQATTTNEATTVQTDHIIHDENHIIRPNGTSAIPKTSLSNSTVTSGLPSTNATLVPDSNFTSSSSPTISPKPPAETNQTSTDTPTAAPVEKPLPPHSDVPPGDGEGADQKEEDHDKQPSDTKPWNPRPPLNPKPSTPVSPLISCSDEKGMLPYLSCQSVASIKTHPITFVLMMIALLAYCCHICQRRRRTGAARGEYRALAAHYNDDVFGDDYSAESIPSDEDDEEYESWGTSNKGHHRTIEMKTLGRETNGGLTLEEMNG